MNKTLIIISASLILFFSGCSFNFSNRHNTIGRISSIPFGSKTILIPSDKELDRDVRIIPDKYNTGVKAGTVLTPFYQDRNSHNINGVNILHRRIVNKNGEVYFEFQIIGKENLNLPSETIIENYDFSALKFTFQPGNVYNENKTIIFRNCKFKNILNSGDNNPFYLVFENCTFVGNVSETNIYMDHCYLGQHLSDAGNPLKNYIVKDCYVSDLVVDPLTNGEVHIDGFQSFGRKGIVGGPVLLDNVRFEIPAIHYENTNAGVNSSVMLQLQYGSIHHVYYMNLICNGGGKNFPIFLKDFPQYPACDVHMINVSVSNNYGTIFYPIDYHTGADVKNVEHNETLYVSSVWKDSEGVHIICSNDTNIDKTLVVKTDKGDFTFDIPHCPSDFALSGDNSKNHNNPNEVMSDKDGRPYKEYRFEDMPFDLDCKIPVSSNVTSIECYDGETRIRKVEF